MPKQDRLEEQINRLEVGPHRKANIKYDMEIKQTKEGRFNYRIIRKTPSASGSLVEWGGTLNIREEIYVSPPKGCTTRIEAAREASEWLQKYERGETQPKHVKKEQKKEDKQPEDSQETQSDTEE